MIYPGQKYPQPVDPLSDSDPFDFSAEYEIKNSM
jgi:hypothetical protein